MKLRFLFKVMSKHKVLILGAGKIGSSIAKLLSKEDDYDVSIADISNTELDKLKQNFPVKTYQVDLLQSQDEVKKLISESSVVISALSFYLNEMISRLCLEAGASYFDLTEDVQTTKFILDLSTRCKDGQVFMPQCGLAPGFVGIVGNDLACRLDSVDTLLMRVGALPMYPTNMLKYNLTWSTDGLINEYCNPCEAIHDGKLIDVLPLEGLEHFSVDGLKYEAFNTSGGLGTLCDTWSGRAKTVNYKTVRYLGHRELVKFLLEELKFNEKRGQLKEVFEASIPVTNQDVVVIFCTVTGQKNGKLSQITDARKIYHGRVHGEDWSAIQITTASGMCVAVDLFLNKKLPQKGFIGQEEIRLQDFLENRFGKYFALNNNTNVTVKPVDIVLS
jgi:saccharopine dehydrogenase-like NADP-dependent oxidoreductase